MKVVDVTKIEAVIICFDWSRMVIPNDFVKYLAYDDSKINNKVVLEIDLDYIKNHKYFLGNDLDYYQKHHISSDSKLTIWERLQGRDVWSLDIVSKDKTITIDLPSNRKDYYCHESCYIMAFDAVNECEVHSTDKGIFKIVWSQNDVYMNEEELKLFLANENLSKRKVAGVTFGISLLASIFKDKLGDLKNVTFKEEHQKIDNVEVITLTLNNNRIVNVVLVTNQAEKEIIDQAISEDNNYWLLISNDKIGNDKYNDRDRIIVTSDKVINKLWLAFKDDNLL